ncbi:unnamed protein product [Pieris macdunnoughi]|uniref:Uncharacterized protein n=1 Tax=Pieris macdunnoughi TaxID=345717 RepID=A0A821VDU1_9NEOP|nr:unnamed protein product [Pieris macdunnoughi]
MLDDDFQSYHEEAIKYGFNQVPFSKVKAITYNKSNWNIFQYKTRFRGPTTSVDINKQKIQILSDNILQKALRKKIAEEKQGTEEKTGKRVIKEKQEIQEKLVRQEIQKKQERQKKMERLEKQEIKARGADSEENCGGDLLLPQLPQKYYKS